MSFFKQSALISKTTTIASAGATTTLVATSATNVQITGSMVQTIVLPNATTVSIGRLFRIMNRSTQSVTVNYNGGSLAATIASNSEASFTTIDNSTSIGTWDVSLPATGTGTVTSVTFTGDGIVLDNTPSPPVTASGTLTASLKAVGTNTALMGPVGGGIAGTPTFRGIQAPDRPLAVMNLTTTYSVGATDDVLLCSGSAFTITLPAAIGVPGRVLYIKKTDASALNIITIARTGSDTIDGALTLALTAQYETAVLISDAASNWAVISTGGSGGGASLQVMAKARNTTGSITINTPINYDSIDFDTAGAITTGAGWKFTVPITGYYLVSTGSYLNPGASLEVFVNGVVGDFISSAGPTTPYITGTTILSCVAGDAIDIRPDGSTAGVNQLIIDIALISGGASGGGTPVSVDVPTVTDEVAYTPTFVGFGTVSNVNFVSSRRGDKLFFRGTFTAGTVTATVASFTIGFNGTDSNVSSAATVTTNTQIGIWTRDGMVPSAAELMLTLLGSASTTTINFGYNSAGTSGLSPAGGNSIIGSGETVSIQGEIPISGWTANQTFTLGASTVISPAFFMSSMVTTLSTAITGTSFSTFDNSPAFTFTPTVTGKYKVYASAAFEMDGTGIGGVSQIVNTTGGATLLGASSGILYVTATSEIFSVYIQSVFTLTAGVSYVFDIQGKLTSGGGNFYINATNGAFYMFAERVS